MDLGLVEFSLDSVRVCHGRFRNVGGDSHGELVKVLIIYIKNLEFKNNFENQTWNVLHDEKILQMVVKFEKL